MLLQRLRDYADRVALPPPNYQPLGVHWIVRLDESGKFLGLVETTTIHGKNRKRIGLIKNHPYRKRSGTQPPPSLITDTASYVFGKPKSSSIKDVEFAKWKNHIYKELLTRAWNETKEPSLRAILNFYQNHSLDSLLGIAADVSPSENTTFRVGEVFPVDIPTIISFWANYLEEHSDTTKAQCLVCGKEKPIVKRHPIPLKNIPGKRAEYFIVSANKAAFESYGLKASLIAPTCSECAEAYAKAANHLIAGERTHVELGPVVYLFWTKEKEEWSPVNLLSRPDPAQVKALFQSVERGREVQQEIRANEFYATAFSASGSRVAVRDWLETTIPKAQEKLAQWFRWQRIVDTWTGEIGNPLPVQGYFHEKQYYVGLADHLAPVDKNRRRKVGDLPAQVFQTLTHAALTGKSLPDWLLFQAVRRNCAEQTVTYPRAALIKSIFHSQNNQEVYMERLDQNQPSAGYHCGRLLAVLEAIQKRAIPEIKATLTDRFYGAASSAPGSVFGGLMNKATTAHLSKLRKEQPGMYSIFERQLEDISEMLVAFPKVLTLEDQGLFALGFYHQKAQQRKDAIEAKAKKESQLQEKAQ